MQRNWKPRTLLVEIVEMQNGEAAVENSMEVLQKNKNKTII